MDRNFTGTLDPTKYDRSLSARRAWIEIYFMSFFKLQRSVALRKESVDRNGKSKRLKTEKHKVALRKESVDRNCDLEPIQNAEAVVALRKESVDRNRACKRAI